MSRGIVFGMDFFRGVFHGMGIFKGMLGRVNGGGLGGLFMYQPILDSKKFSKFFETNSPLFTDTNKCSVYLTDVMNTYKKLVMELSNCVKI